MTEAFSFFNNNEPALIRELFELRWKSCNIPFLDHFNISYSKHEHVISSSPTIGQCSDDSKNFSKLINHATATKLVVLDRIIGND